MFLPDIGDAEPQLLRFNDMPKARLVRPEMEPPSMNWTEVAARSAWQSAGGGALHRFTGRAREEVKVDKWLEQPEFWTGLRGLAQRVGVEPVLLICRDETEELVGLNYRRAGPLAALDVSDRRPSRDRGHYVAGIEGVEVFATDLAKGVAWLFSARHLRRLG